MGSRCEGVLYGPRRNREVEFYWNIGIDTNNKNNKVEAYTLF
jgi:hypothetical protein